MFSAYQIVDTKTTTQDSGGDSGDPGSKTSSSQISTITVDCFSAFLNADQSTTLSCSTTVPKGYYYFAVIIQGQEKAVVFTATVSAVSSCCNHHGFCSNDTSDCDCQYDEDYGYWDASTSCKTCIAGYTGSQCVDFDSEYNVVESGLKRAGTGDTDFYSVSIASGMTFSAAITGEGDCDLAVSYTQHCQSGWSLLDGNCYKIMETATEPTNAIAKCLKYGGQLSVPMTPREWDLMEDLFYQQNVLGSESPYPAPQVTVGLQRLQVLCSDSKPGLTGNNIPKDRLGCPGHFCEWRIDGSSYKCQTREKYRCWAQTTEWDCHNYVDSTTGMTARRLCVYERWAVGHFVCTNGWFFTDGRGSEETATALMQSSRHEMYLNGTSSHCDQFNREKEYNSDAKYAMIGNQFKCNKLPHYCVWLVDTGDGSGLCKPSMTYPSYEDKKMGSTDSTSVDINYSWHNTEIACARIVAANEAQNTLTKPRLTIVMSYCSESKATQKTTYSKTSAQLRQVPYLCRGPVLGTLSKQRQVQGNEVDRIEPMSNPNLELFGNPDCNSVSSVTDDKCSSRPKKPYAMMRVTCLAPQSSYNLRIAYVPRSRYYLGTSGACINDRVLGHWAGSICTTCQPWWTGSECTERIRCTPNTCGPFGHCISGLPGTSYSNTTLGTCKCSANYYGMYCDTYCSNRLTCNGHGTCNRKYQLCNVTYGVASKCQISDSLCDCAYGFQGSVCDSCISGFYGKNCSTPCNCNGQSCHRVTGKCKCVSDPILGFYNSSNGCRSCSASYYGLQCTLFCHPKQTCSSHGTCTTQGTCQCYPNYFGTSCSVFCSGKTCGDHGSCDADGACTCVSNNLEGYWDGDLCDKCSDGYWGTACLDECKCNNHGTCEKISGQCNCFTNAKNGYWAGTSCEDCVTGYVYPQCTDLLKTIKHEFGRAVLLNSPLRTVKNTSTRGGFLHLRTDTQLNRQYMFAGTGAQISMFYRDLGKLTMRNWVFGGACDYGVLFGGLGGIAGGVIVGDYLYVAYQAEPKSFIFTVKVKPPGLVFANGGCTITSKSSINWVEVRDSRNATSRYNVTDIVADVQSSVLYVSYRRRDMDNDPSILSVVKIARINISSLTTFAVGLDDGSTFNTLDLVHGMIFVKDALENTPILYLYGLDLDETPLILKIFPPVNSQLEYRTLFAFTPGLCVSLSCTQIDTMIYHEGSLYMIMERSQSTRTHLLVRVNVTATQLKNVSNNYNYTVVTNHGNSTGSGFIIVDNMTRTLYFSVDLREPSKLFQSTLDLQILPSYHQLEREYSDTERQISVAAYLDNSVRALYVLNRMTSTEVMAFNLWHVTDVEPKLMDGGGGTLVTVTGFGFNMFDAYDRTVVLCKFGSLYLQSSNATQISSTKIVCKAPLVVGFDPCGDVALEVGYACTKCTDSVPRFSADAIQVRHIAMSTLDSILPSNRGFLNYSTPLTIVGTGFINSKYLKCLIDEVVVPGTYVSSKQVTCLQPNRPSARTTSLSVTLDGQMYSNKLLYYIIGLPAKMNVFWNDDPTATEWSIEAKPKTQLPTLTARFLDGVGNEIKDRQEALINSTVTLQLVQGVASIAGTQYGKLLRNVSTSISLVVHPANQTTTGEISFTLLNILNPAAGTYTILVNCSYGFSAKISFTVFVRTSKVVFTQTPRDYTTSKSTLPRQPILTFQDDIGNVATKESSKLKVSFCLTADCTPPGVVIDPRASTTTKLIKGDEDTAVQYDSGVVTYKTLAVFSSVQDIWLTLQFTFVSDPRIFTSYAVRIAVCNSSDARISSIYPSIGRLGSQLVTINGWDFREENMPTTFCRYGIDPPSPAMFIDTCNIVCGLGPRSKSDSAPLEVSVTNPPLFTAFKLNYSYVDVIDALQASSANSTYKSDASITLTDIRVKAVDAFGNQLVRDFDTEERIVYFKSSLPLVSGTYPEKVKLQGGEAVISKIRAELPKTGIYYLYFSTKDEAIPQSVLSGGSATSVDTIKKVRTKTQIPRTMSASLTISETITRACPKAKACVYQDFNHLVCVYENSFMYSATPTIQRVRSVTQVIHQGNTSFTNQSSTIGNPPPLNVTNSSGGLTNSIITSSPRPTLGGYYFRQYLRIQVTSGIPKMMKFDGSFSLFTTSKRKLDVQPVIRITDLAGNTVLSFDTSPLVIATLDPNGLCLSSSDSEESCERLKGSQESVSGGIAQYQNLWFKGTPGILYTLTFSVTLAGVDSITSSKLYAADCPTSNDPVDSVNPNWVSVEGGVTVTIKGWDFQPSRKLTLVFGDATLPVVYVDTCTATADIPLASSLHHTHPIYRALQSTKPGGMSISVIDTANPDFKSKAISFQVKSRTATKIGFSSSARTALFPNGVTNTTTCTTTGTTTTSTTSVSRECYEAKRRIYLDTVIIVQQDEAGGELYSGVGWSSDNFDIDVEVVLVSFPGTENRTTAHQILGNVDTTQDTKNGMMILSGGYIDNPRSGDYVFNFSTTSLTALKTTFSSTTYIIRVVPGPAVKLTLTSLDNPKYIHPVHGPIYHRKDQGDLGMTLSISDVVGNPISSTSLGSGSASVGEAVVTLRAAHVIMPSPLQDIYIPESAVQSEYGGSQGLPASIQPPRAVLTTDFSFLTSKINSIWYGIRYNITFSLSSTSTFSSSLQSLSILVELANCDNFQTMYGVNLTSKCADVPDGANVYGNTSVFLAPQSGYWRSSYTSTVFFSCAADNCPGGFWGECKDGTEGPTCAVCEDGWGKQGDVCLECPEMYVNVLALGGMIVLTLFIIIIMVRTNLSTEVKAKSLLSIIIKVLMNHLQTSTLMEEFQAEMRGIVKALMGVQEKTNPDTNISNFACASGWTQYSIFLMWMMSPSAVVVIPGIIAVMSGIRSKRTLSKRKKELHAEIERRRRLGLDTEDQEAHLRALETGEVPVVAVDDKDSVEAPSENGDDDHGAQREFDLDQIESMMREQQISFEDALNRERQEKEVEMEKRAEADAQRANAATIDYALQRIENAIRVLQRVESSQEARKTATDILRTYNQSVSHESVVWDAQRVATTQPSEWERADADQQGRPLWRHKETDAVTFHCPPGFETTTEHHSVVTNNEEVSPAQEPTEQQNKPKLITTKDAGEASSGTPSVNATPREHGRNRLMDQQRRRDAAALDALRASSKKETEGLKKCSVCNTDFAVCFCTECPALKHGDETSYKNFCEACFVVLHDSEDTKNHVKTPFKVVKTEVPDLTERYADIRQEIIRKHSTMNPKEIFVVTVLVIIFMIYPTLMTQIATMMKCVPISTLHRSYLAVDMRIECDTPEYDRWKQLAQIFFFLYGLGIPVCGSLVLYRRRKRLLARSTLATYGFLYSGFRLNRYYWEFIIMVRKMLVVFIIVFWSGQRALQIVLGQWVITVFLMLNIFARPFQLRLLWRLENCSLASVAITLNAAALYQPTFALSNTETEVVTVIIFIVNLAVLLVFAYYLYVAARMQFVSTLDSSKGEMTVSDMKEAVHRKMFEKFGPKLEALGYDNPYVTPQMMEARERERQLLGE